jgi:hypothetical protein
MVYCLHRACGAFGHPFSTRWFFEFLDPWRSWLKFKPRVLHRRSLSDHRLILLDIGVYGTGSLISTSFWISISQAWKTLRVFIFLKKTFAFVRNLWHLFKILFCHFYADFWRRNPIDIRQPIFELFWQSNMINFGHRFPTALQPFLFGKLWNISYNFCFWSFEFYFLNLGHIHKLNIFRLHYGNHS